MLLRYGRAIIRQTGKHQFVSFIWHKIFIAVVLKAVYRYIWLHVITAVPKEGCNIWLIMINMVFHEDYLYGDPK